MTFMPNCYINSSMAYTFFPEKKAEIIKQLKNQPEKVADIIELFDFLKKKYSNIKAPINIDKAKLNVVNVTRELQGSIEIKDIQRAIDISKIKIKFGAGSSGNRGAANRGNLFESTFANSLRDYWGGEQLNDPAIEKAVMHLDKTYKLSKLKNLEVVEEGALNQSRPLRFMPGPVITSSAGGLDIGKIVTDLTIKSKGKQIAYLSLKLGGTTTFFNVGIKKILTPDEIKTGTIKNKDGLKLLKMFGIDNKMFCDIFNGTLKKGVSKNTFNKVNKSYLEAFIQSGMGYGFHVIHKLSNEVKSIKIDKPYMVNSSKPKSCIVFYGGKTGSGKRIDMEILTNKYKMKFNMRDTQGGDGYPTRIMGDFTYL